MLKLSYCPSPATTTNDSDEPIHLAIQDAWALRSTGNTCFGISTTQASRKYLLDKKLKTFTAHTSLVTMRKPQPVKVFDVAAFAPQSSVQPCCTTTTTTGFREKPVQPSTFGVQPCVSSPESVFRIVKRQESSSSRCTDQAIPCHRGDLPRQVGDSISVGDKDKSSEYDGSSLRRYYLHFVNGVNTPKRTIKQVCRRIYCKSSSKVVTSIASLHSTNENESNSLRAHFPNSNPPSTAHFTAFCAVQPRSQTVSDLNFDVVGPAAQASTKCYSTSFTPASNCKGFFADLTELRGRGWYWGPLTSEQAERVLAERENGCFLVRDSSHEMYILSLSFRSNGITGHVRIEHQGGKFRFTSEPTSYHAATSVIEFIERVVKQSRSGQFQYFVQETMPGYPVALLWPVSRFETVGRLRHLCRFEILKHTRCDHIDALPLPNPLKDYLKEKQFYVDTSTLPSDALPS